MAILSNHTPVKDPAVYDQMIWPGLHPDGKLNVSNLQDQQEWYKEKGQIEQLVPQDKLVNTSFAEAAARELGPYQN